MTISESRRVGATPVKRPKFKFVMPQWPRSLGKVLVSPFRWLFEAVEDAGQDPRDTYFGWENRDDD